ncbi:MAG: ATP-binding protein, partial [Bacteroidota bacterium]
LASLDASIYTARGELLATSQPLIFDDQILSKRINPVALPVTGTGTPSVVEEKLGKLEYKSTYYALRSPQTASVVGILGIPFFESNLSLEREQITILSNMSIIFAVTLILFTLFSFVAVRWLTFPLQMITRSLSNTSLKRTNRLLEWKSDDEIGMMVHEYNRMVLNLEQNKIDLARSQKENAWREMAQQVAHEIKNPLTPMKLTLQQMERSLLEDQLSKERATRSVDTLLAQLEILNDIATSFSTFAKMPAPNLVRVDLNQTLKQVVMLYANHPGGVVEFQPRSAVFIMGDEPLLSRIFSNLVLNALQSSQEVTAVSVHVRLEPLVNTVKVFVEDNGQGIDASLGDKIFMPHFTTKKSGSGLGLAIAKQGIEQCGGSITFRANAPKGTVFEVEFPLA